MTSTISKWKYFKVKRKCVRDLYKIGLRTEYLEQIEKN